MNNLQVGLTNIAVGLLMIALCLPLVKRKIKMNRWYGMRFPKSYSSEENWYRINEYGGKLFIVWSAVLVILGGLILFLDPLNSTIASMIASAPLLLLIPTIQLYFYSRKL